MTLNHKITETVETSKTTVSTVAGSPAAETVVLDVSAGHSPADEPISASNDTKTTVSTVPAADCGSAAKSFVGNQAYKSPFPLPTGAAGGLSTRRAAGHGTDSPHPVSAPMQLNPGFIKGFIWGSFKPQPLNEPSGAVVSDV